MSKTIGVYGTGSTPKRAAVALLRDFIGDDDDVTLVLPLTEEHFTESTKALAKYAVDHELSITAVISDAGQVPDDAEEYLDVADTKVKVTKVGTSLVGTIAKAGGSLFLAFDPEDDDTNDAMESAVARGLRPLDLTDGLQPLYFEDEALPATPAPEPEPEPEPVEEAPKRTRRSRTPVVNVEEAVAAVHAPVEVADEAQQTPPVTSPVMSMPPAPAAGPVSLVEDVELGRAVKVLLLALAEAQMAVAEPKRGPGRPRKQPAS